MMMYEKTSKRGRSQKELVCLPDLLTRNPRELNVNPNLSVISTSSQSKWPPAVLQYIQSLNMPPKKQQSQTSSSSKVKVDKVGHIFVYHSFSMILTMYRPSA